MRDFNYNRKSATVQTIENFVITETQNGKIKTVLNSNIAVIKESEQVAFLTEPVVKFYDNGKYSATLTAKTGQISLDTNNVKALGECKVVTANGEVLETKDVDYDHMKEKVSSDSDIKITKGKDVIYGKGFESDTNLNNIIIKNQRIILD
jgi:LPS export ABC transporter protein LptC